MRFKLEKSELKPNHWVCSDLQHQVVCVFEHGNFNDNQETIILDENMKPDPLFVARVVNEMAAWLQDNHYDKLFQVW